MAKQTQETGPVKSEETAVATMDKPTGQITKNSPEAIAARERIIARHRVAARLAPLADKNHPIGGLLRLMVHTPAKAKLKGDRKANAYNVYRDAIGTVLSDKPAKPGEDSPIVAAAKAFSEQLVNAARDINTLMFDSRGYTGKGGIHADTMAMQLLHVALNASQQARSFAEATYSEAEIKELEGENK